MKIPFLVIGGGLSGLAAAIRAARYIPDVHLYEKHSRFGGLNSYFHRNGRLYETGLHAITNFAPANDKKAPLNRLLRQLKISRSQLTICQQRESRVQFLGVEALRFSNDFELFDSEIRRAFPHCYDRFVDVVAEIDAFDPFKPHPFISARKFLQERLGSRLLTDMLLCPLMYYGSSLEDDMEFGQFTIMFRAIFQEGMFRPAGDIKSLIELLINQFSSNGGQLHKGCGVRRILVEKQRCVGVELEDGQQIECDFVLSTIGYQETLRLLDHDKKEVPKSSGRLGFVETIFELPNPIPAGAGRESTPGSASPAVTEGAASNERNTTIIFYNNGETFHYRNPHNFFDPASGVICFPANFTDLPQREFMEIRATHLADYDCWLNLRRNGSNPLDYKDKKKLIAASSAQVLENIVGSFTPDIVYQNTFTPLTIERYTGKIAGAIYGNPQKIPDGTLGLENVFLAGTDQGFLGIVGSMLSGVSIVNQHILPKL